MLTKKSRLLLGLTVATPLLFAACTDNGIFNPMSNAAGTYQLTVYAGHGIPAHFVVAAGDPNFPNGAIIDVPSGTLVLNSNGAFVETNNIVVTQTGQSSVSNDFISSGTWTLNGTDLTLSAPAQNNTSARFVTGILDTNFNNRLAINYSEDDGTGTVNSFEYVR
jgi:hypothetical protein